MFIYVVNRYSDFIKESLFALVLRDFKVSSSVKNTSTNQMKKLRRELRWS